MNRPCRLSASDQGNVVCILTLLEIETFHIAYYNVCKLFLIINGKVAGYQTSWPRFIPRSLYFRLAHSFRCVKIYGHYIFIHQSQGSQDPPNFIIVYRFAHSHFISFVTTMQFVITMYESKMMMSKWFNCYSCLRQPYDIFSQPIDVISCNNVRLPNHSIVTTVYNYVRQPNDFIVITVYNNVRQPNELFSVL